MPNTRSDSTSPLGPIVSYIGLIEILGLEISSSCGWVSRTMLNIRPRRW